MARRRLSTSILSLPTVPLRSATGLAVALTALTALVGLATAAPQPGSALAAAPAAPVVSGLSVHVGDNTGGTKDSDGIVVVSGSGFTGVQRVTFGSVQAQSVTVQSGSRLSVVSPGYDRLHGTVHVRVSTADGTSAPNPASRFRFEAAPAIDGVYPDDVPASAGRPVTIEGDYLNLVTRVYFGGVEGYDLIHPDRGAISVVPPAHKPGEVRVRLVTRYDRPRPTLAFRYASRSDDVRWSRPRPVRTDGNPVTALSCSSRVFCMATTAVGDAIVDHHGRWTRLTSQGGNGSLSCASRSFCLSADGDDAQLRTWDGQRWSALAGPFRRVVDQVECTSSTFCVAVGDRARVAVWDGASWTTPTDPRVPGHGKQYVLAVSCWRDGGCAADLGSGVAVLDGSTWRWTYSVGPDVEASDPGAFTCFDARHCALGEYSGDVELLDSRGIHVTKAVMGEPVEQLDCTSPDACLAAGARATATWDGTSWSVQGSDPPVPQSDSAFVVTALSCPRPGTCVAAGGNDIAEVAW